MAITKKQRLAMALILLSGVLAGAALLLSGRPPGGAAAAHEGEHQEAHQEAHDAHEAHEAHEAQRLLRLSAAQIRQAGIALEAAGPARLQAAAEFSGEIRFNEDRTAHVVPRVAGVAQQVRVRLGEAVRQGQLLAVIASHALSEQRSELLSAQERRAAALQAYEREKKLWEQQISAEQDYLQARSALREADIALRNAGQKLAALGAAPDSAALNRYELRAPFDGTVVEKHLAPGEAVREDATLFTLSDLRSVWAEFNVAPQDLALVRVGQRVAVSSTAFADKVEGRIAYVGALLGEQTRTARARVTLDNPAGAWRPGLFVTVTVFGAEQAVALSVPAEAVQRVDERPMVFKAVAGGFEPTPVRLGRSDGRRVEVLAGLQAGEQVAVGNSFLLKSELGKASAGHEH